MLNVNLNGLPLSGDFSSTRTMGELIEAVKTKIDPDTIIVDISFSGEALNEKDWNLPVSQHDGKTLEISTGTKEKYISERLTLSPEIVEKIIAGFTEAALSYKNGLTVDGNQQLQAVVGDLDAFVRWYSSLLAMDKSLRWSEQFSSQVEELKKACELIFQQQLYNSWWVLADTINTRLNPCLDHIKNLCDQIASQASK